MRRPSPPSPSFPKYLCASKSCLLGDEGKLARRCRDGGRDGEVMSMCGCLAGTAGRCVVGWGGWASLDKPTGCRPACASTLALVMWIFHSPVTAHTEVADVRRLPKEDVSILGRSRSGQSQVKWLRVSAREQQCILYVLERETERGHSGRKGMNSDNLDSFNWKRTSNLFPTPAIKANHHRAVIFWSSLEYR